MAKGSHNPNIKVALFLFLLLFLPLAVFYASNSQLNENRSRAANLVGEGGCSEDQILYQRYSISVTGVESCQKKRVILDAVLNAYSYPSLGRKLGDTPLEFKNIDENNRNWAYTTNKNLIKLYRFEAQLTDKEWKYIITHELFHVLYQRRNTYLDKYNSAYSSLANTDRSCFRNTSKGKVIKTYAAQVPENAKHESFAESGVLYILGESPFNQFGEINNFRGQCGNSYEWFDENIF